MLSITMRGSRGRRAFAAALAAAALLVTAGCNGSSKGSAGSPASADDFDPNGVLRIGVEFGQMTPLDPIDDTGVTTPAGYLADLIYGHMLGEGDTVDQSTPGLAEEWSTPDDSTIKLTLRDDVKFSDGTPLDAAAVKFSWERCKNDDGFKLDQFQALDTVTADDETHVTVTLSKPIAGVWVNYLLRQGVYCMPIVSPTAVDKGDDFEARPVGAGPYMVDQNKPGQLVTLVRNPEFYDPSQQTFKEIQFIQTATGPATVTALNSGQIDLAAVAPSQYRAVTGRNEVVQGESSLITHINMCTTEGPLASADARKAVLAAIDPDEINKAIYQDEFTVDRQVLPEFNPFYSEAGADENKFDLDTAKELAKSSGLAGQSIDLMYFSISPDWATMSELIKSQLTKIDVTVNLIPSQNIFADKLAQKPDMDIWVWFPESIPTTLAPGQINNTCGTDDPTLNEALGSIYRADQAAAAEAWDTVQSTVSDQALVLPLLNNTSAIAHSDKVIGDFVLPKNGFWLLDWTKIGMAKN